MPRYIFKHLTSGRDQETAAILNDIIEAIDVEATFSISKIDAIAKKLGCNITPSPTVNQVYLEYTTRDRYGTTDLVFTTEADQKIWQQLTGRKTIRENDIGLIADLTRGRVRFKKV